MRFVESTKFGGAKPVVSPGRGKLFKKSAGCLVYYLQKKFGRGYTIENKARGFQSLALTCFLIFAVGLS